MPFLSHSQERVRKKARMRIQVESLETRQLLSVDTLLGASATRASYHVDGTGLSAAVIDTGIDAQDSALGGGVGNGFKVAASQSFLSNSAGTSVSSSHATAVAGLIASSDPQLPGIAPGAGLIDLKVFNDAGQGSFDAVASALQWVIDHRVQYHIGVVNLSLSDGNNYQHDWFSGDGGIGSKIDGLIKRLNALNVPVVAAAGNSFNGQAGMGFTAILPETISVASTGPNGRQLASDAQRLGSNIDPLSATKLVAPGVGLNAPAPGNQIATVDGSSFSAALVSGSVLLLEQIYQNRFGRMPSVSQLEGWLQAGSDPVYDPITNATYDRLDIAKAAALIPQPNVSAASNPPSSSIVSPPTADNPSPDPKTTAAASPSPIVPPTTAQPTAPPSKATAASATAPVSGPVAQIIADQPLAQTAPVWTSWPSVYLNDPALNLPASPFGRPAGSVRQLIQARHRLEQIMRHQRLPLPHLPQARKLVSHPPKPNREHGFPTHREFFRPHRFGAGL